MKNFLSPFSRNPSKQPNERPQPRHSVATLCAVVHLCFLVAFVSTGFPQNVGAPWLRHPLVIYQNLSGLFRDYGYFAPRVGTDLRATFLLELRSGGTEVFNFTSNNQEASLRYNNILMASMRDEQGRDLFSRSLAAKVLGERVDATKVTIVVEGRNIPEMRDYQQGMRPEWYLVYAGTFNRSIVADQVVP